MNPFVESTAQTIIPNSDQPRFGCLILHGFTSCADSVNRIPLCLPEGMPYRMPYLRGHGTQPEDLRGVTWHDWYTDALTALQDLRREVDHVIVIGLSMGGLVANHLAASRPADIVGIVSIAAAMRFGHKHAHRARYIAPFVGMWGKENRDTGIGWHDQEAGRRHRNYRRFPTRSFVSLWNYARIVEQQLPRITVPILVIHSKADRTILVDAAHTIFAKVSSSDKELVIFEHSGHEMLRDSEAPAVLELITTFIQHVINQHHKE